MLSFDGALRPGDWVTLRNDTIRAYGSQSAAASGSTYLEQTFTYLITDDVIYARTTVGTNCGSWVADGTVHLADVGRPVNYHWTLLARPDLTTSFELLHADQPEYKVSPDPAYRSQLYLDGPVQISLWLTQAMAGHGLLGLSPADRSDHKYLRVVQNATNHFGISRVTVLDLEQNPEDALGEPEILIEVARGGELIKGEPVALKCYVGLPECWSTEQQAALEEVQLPICLCFWLFSLLC